MKKVNKRGSPRYNSKPKPKYGVYHLVYDFGDSSYDESVVAASSPEKAEDLLANHLFSLFLEEVDIENTVFLVRSTFSTGIKADKERVITPRIPSDLEIMLAAMATQTELRT